MKAIPCNKNKATDSSHPAYMFLHIMPVFPLLRFSRKYCSYISVILMPPLIPDFLD